MLLSDLSIAFVLAYESSDFRILVETQLAIFSELTSSKPCDAQGRITVEHSLQLLGHVVYQQQDYRQLKCE